MGEVDVGLADRTFGFLLDPLIEAGDVIVVHALNFGNFLSLFDFIEADCTIFFPYIIDDLPLYPIPIGSAVLLPEQELVSNSQPYVERIVK